MSFSMDMMDLGESGDGVHDHQILSSVAWRSQGMFQPCFITGGYVLTGIGGPRLSCVGFLEPSWHGPKLSSSIINRNPQTRQLDNVLGLLSCIMSIKMQFVLIMVCFTVKLYDHTIALQLPVFPMALRRLTEVGYFLPSDLRPVLAGQSRRNQRMASLDGKRCQPLWCLASP